MSRLRIAQAAIVFFAGLTLLSSSAFARKSTITCEVAIVGGGAAGIYTFYQLAPDLGNKICLFEKSPYFGGRIKDIASPNGNGKWGAGALRVMPQQTVLLNLASELAIALQRSDPIEQRFFARGVFHTDTNDFAGAGNPYPSIAAPDYPEWSCVGESNYSVCFGDAFWQLLFRNPGPAPGANQ
jgi:hypothetical protein